MHEELQSLSVHVFAVFELVAETARLLSQGSFGEEALTIITSHARQAFDVDLCAIVTPDAEGPVIRAVSTRTAGTALPFPLMIDQHRFGHSLAAQPGEHHQEIQRVTGILRPALLDSGWFVVAAAPFLFLSCPAILLCAHQMEGDKQLFSLGRGETLALSQFASLAALVARLGEKEVIRPRHEIIDTFLADLFSPSHVESQTAKEDLLWRAWMVGMDLRETHVVVLLGVVGIAERVAGPVLNRPLPFDGSTNRVAYFQHILEDVRKACQQQLAGLFTIDEDLRLLCLVQLPQGNEQHLRSILEHLITDVAQSYSIRLFSSISDPQREIGEYPLAYQQAVDTYEMGRKLYPDAKVLHHRELGIVRYIDPGLIRDLSDDPNIDLIRHIDAYDQQHSTALLPTLEAYILSGGNLSGAALLLETAPSVHVTTIKKRIGRLKDKEVAGPYAFDIANTPRRWPELLAALQVYRLQKIT